MNGVLTLYRAPFSTNVERIALALAHKGLSVRSVIIDHADRKEVQRVSGQPLVPVLVDGELFHQILERRQTLGPGHAGVGAWIRRVDAHPRA